MTSSGIDITVTVNGKRLQRRVEPRLLLVDFIRRELRLTGTHVGCAQGVCGACTIMFNGQTARSCLTFAVQAHEAQIVTVEGLDADKQLSPIQQAFHEEHALQCGYCTPGLLMRVQELLADNPSPTDTEIRRGIAGHLCRCTGYVNIVRAVRKAAEMLRAKDPVTEPPQ